MGIVSTGAVTSAPARFEPRDHGRIPGSGRQELTDAFVQIILNVRWV